LELYNGINIKLENIDKKPQKQYGKIVREICESQSLIPLKGTKFKSFFTYCSENGCKSNIEHFLVSYKKSGQYKDLKKHTNFWSEKKRSHILITTAIEVKKSD